MIEPTILHQDNGTWLFTWTGTGPFEIWHKGMLLVSTTEVSYVFVLPGYDDDPPPLEIIDTASEEAESNLYPPFLLFQWRGIANASLYSIERYENGEWVKKGFRQENGAGYYTFQSQALDDDADEIWRIRPVDSRGNFGTAMSIARTIVRNPAPPEAVIDFSPAGNVTVTEA